MGRQKAAAPFKVAAVQIVRELRMLLQTGATRRVSPDIFYSKGHTDNANA